MESRKNQPSWKIFIYFIVLPIALFLGVSCSVLWLGQAVWEPPVLVSVKGEESCAVIYWHGIELFAPVQKGQAISVPTRNDDLLFTMDEFLFPYKSSDGQSLTFSGDKTRAELNGSTVLLNLDKDKAWKWLKKASPGELKNLRFLNIEDKLNAQQIAGLQRVARVNPEVGLWITQYEAWQEIANVFDPAWLMIDGGLQEQDRDRLTKMKNIRAFGIHNPQHELNFLSKMTGLETLIIHDWDPSKTGPLPDNLPSLKRIILVDSGIVDLSSLGKQPKLLELNIHESKTLADLSPIKYYPELRLLSLHESKKELDLGHLKTLIPISRSHFPVVE